MVTSMPCDAQLVSATVPIRSGGTTLVIVYWGGPYLPPGPARHPVSAQGAAEGPDVVGEQVRGFHRGEMATPVILRPVLDLAKRIHETPDRGVRGEDGDPGRRTGLLAL